MYLMVCMTAFLASFLTLLSGFGLGTLLMPAFAIYFSVDTAIAMTAVVHMVNNIIKIALVGRKADRNVLLKFAPTAILSALAGAWLLTNLSDMPIIFHYMIGQRTFQVTLVKVVIGILMIGFAFMELIPTFEKIKFDAKWLPLGGIISGFFGGLSGHQGAFRSAFLSKAGLDKEAFIATGVVIAVMIDITRISIYADHIVRIGAGTNWKLVLAATLSALTGSLTSARFMKKVTLRSVHMIVGVMLIVIGALLGIGLI